MRRRKRVGKIDEYPLAVAQRGDTDQGPDSFDVSPGFADEPSDVLVGELDLDGHRPAAALEGLDRYLVRLLGQGLRDVLHHRAVIDARSTRRRPVAPETAASAIDASAPKVTPWGLASLHVAQGFPPASTSCAPLRWAGRPAAATSSLCPRRS